MISIRTSSLSMPVAAMAHQIRRSLMTTACVWGKKSRVPFDRRFPITPKDVNEHKEGGRKRIRQLLGSAEGRPQPAGYYNKDGKFVFVPEMVPEFIVPDLTDFKLKPYVSYKVTDIKQSEFTAQDLFDEVYGQAIVDDSRAGKLKSSIDAYLSREKE